MLTRDAFIDRQKRGVARLAAAPHGRRGERQADQRRLVAGQLRAEVRNHLVASAVSAAKQLLAEIRRRAEASRPAQGDLFDPSHWRVM